MSEGLDAYDRLILPYRRKIRSKAPNLLDVPYFSGFMYGDPIPFEKPDLIFCAKDGSILPVEHFEVDGYPRSRKGSRIKRDMAQTEHELMDELGSKETGTAITRKEVTKQELTFGNLEKNFIDVFTDHYHKIPSYRSKVDQTLLSTVSRQEKYPIIFFVEVAYSPSITIINPSICAKIHPPTISLMPPNAEDFQKELKEAADALKNSPSPECDGHWIGEASIGNSRKILEFLKDKTNVDLLIVAYHRWDNADDRHGSPAPRIEAFSLNTPGALEEMIAKTPEKYITLNICNPLWHVDAPNELWISDNITVEEKRNSAVVRTQKPLEPYEQKIITNQFIQWSRAYDPNF